MGDRRDKTQSGIKTEIYEAHKNTTSTKSQVCNITAPSTLRRQQYYHPHDITDPTEILQPHPCYAHTLITPQNQIIHKIIILMDLPHLRSITLMELPRTQHHHVQYIITTLVHLGSVLAL